ncbi:MAG TPA: hypothetical protein VFI93_12595 [Rhizomicrobium sp.]|jgi:hypothetical protein|nr:hypothetical protein [Rhizomicrobium sp.]
MSDDQSSTRSPFANPMVLWGAIGVLVVVVLVAGYFLFFHKGGVTGSSSQTAELSICNATLARARDYGVVPFAAKLTSEDATALDGDGDAAAQTEKRYVCNAAAQESKFAITVGVSCKDMSDAKCFKLYTVKQDDGTLLFNRQM